MSVHLTELDKATAEECALMERELEGFGGEMPDEEAQVRILSSVMAKAGIEMKETIRTDRRKHSRRFIGFAAAAAAALTCVVGAAAYVGFYHRAAVENYFSQDAADKLESQGLAANIVSENEDIRLTVDTMLCDGSCIHGVYTLTALSDEGRDALTENDGLDVNRELFYLDTGEEIEGAGGFSSVMNGEMNSGDEQSWQFDLILKNAAVDMTRPIGMRLSQWKHLGEFDEDGGELCELSTGCFEGISFEFDKTVNVPVRTLTSEDGSELTLTPYGISMVQEGWTYPEIYEGDMEFDKCYVVTADGERQLFIDYMNADNAFCDGRPEYGFFVMNFGGYTDIDDISGIELDGVLYG